jgi:hypothetical protein
MLVVKKECKMAWLQYTVHLQLSIYQSSWLHYVGLHISLSHYIFILLWFSWFQTFAVFCMLYVFFWVISRRLYFICQHFGTLCLFHLHRQVGVQWLNLRIIGLAIWEVWLSLFSSHTFSHMDTPTILKFGHSIPTCLWRWNRQCSQTSAYKIQKPGNYPEENRTVMVYFTSCHAQTMEYRMMFEEWSEQTMEESRFDQV